MFFKRSPKKTIKEDNELLSLYKDSAEIVYLGELYERYIHLVFGVCMKYLRSEEESKDMSMQIFEKLTEVAKTAEIRNFSSWLHVLAKNECLMLLRSRKYKMGRDALEISADGPMDNACGMHLEEEEALEIRLQELELSMEELPPGQKECIRLFYLEQKSYKAIAALTGYELKKIKSYIQNGKRNLKHYMQKMDEES